MTSSLAGTVPGRRPPAGNLSTVIGQRSRTAQDSSPRLLWLQIRVRGDAKAFCAVLLPEGGGEESCAVRERCPITVDKFPAGGYGTALYPVGK